MSDKQANAYTHIDALDTNEGATAAAVDMLTKACASSGEGQKIGLINGIIQHDYIVKLRDKIKEAASG